MITQALPESWAPALGPVLSGPGLCALDRYLQREEAAGKAIYPQRRDRLRAIELTPLEEVRVVILGQDPYHGEGQAHGLAFSVPPHVRVPPSLANIHKELASDLGLARPGHGNLERWGRQGVLLLNSALSVEAGRPGSHQRRGWEELTDAIAAAVADRPDPSVFMLWGSHPRGTAERIAGLAPGGPHLVLTAAHPSPLSAHRGFLGCRHFSRANAFLAEHGRGTVDWRLD